MFDRAKLRDIIENWAKTCDHAGGYIPKGAKDDLFKEMEAFIEAVISTHLSEEAAIEHLQKTGWMQRHEELMTVDSVAAIVNRIMRDGNKSISVSVYPWKEQEDD